MREFVVARNPEEGSSLPYLVRLPLPNGAVVLKVRDVWPRTAAVYCHRALVWPDEPDVVERVAVRSCQRRGAAVDLVLDRARENRSQFVFTQARGRDVIFWQSARTSRQARPNVALPRARAAGLQLEILVDTHERYPWTFSHQQATTGRRALPAGDYAVELDGRIVAVVERKSLGDPGVDDDRRQAPLPPRRARRGAERGGRRRGPLLGGLQARARTAGRFLAAAVAHHHEDVDAAPRVVDLVSAGAVPPPAPTTKTVRAWARDAGLAVTDRGPLPPDVWTAYSQAHPSVAGDG